MLGYQSLSFHDALYLRRACDLRCAPEFEQWLDRIGMLDERGRVVPAVAANSPLLALAAGR
jgi:ethanolamine ammonia-lyase large subunit